MRMGAAMVGVEAGRESAEKSETEDVLGRTLFSL